MDDEETKKQIKKDCLRLLTRREHSRKEIEKKLKLKAYNRKQIKTVLDELCKQSWQDDSRFAESYINMRSKKGFGPIKIAYELQKQGIDKAAIDKLIKSKSLPWREIMERAYLKKFGDIAVKDSADRGKRIRFLRHRGFPSGMIIEVIDSAAKFVSKL